jgi:hypothetical protein
MSHWHLPGGVHIHGPAPAQFGITIVRQAGDDYQLQVRWDGLTMSWDHLSRTEILASSLTPLTTASNTDLWNVLMQPVKSKRAPTLVA